MSINNSWETKFQNWKSPASATEQQQCDNAESVIRRAIANSTALAPRQTRIFAQVRCALVVCYREADQTDEVRAQNTLNREVLENQRICKVAGKKIKYPDEMATKLVNYEINVRLRIEAIGCDCSLEDALGLSSFREGGFVWLHDRQTVDSRLPLEQQSKFHPTVRQLLIFSKNATITRGPWLENDAGWIEIKPDGATGSDGHNFTFGGQNCAFENGETYSLDPNPNDWSGSMCFKQNEKIADGEPNFVYDLLSGNVPMPN